MGRHVRIDPATKLAAGRNATENAALDEFFARDDAPEDCARLCPEDFPGPTALLIGPQSDEALRRACVLIAGYARRLDPAGGVVRVTDSGGSRPVRVPREPCGRRFATL